MSDATSMSENEFVTMAFEHKEKLIHIATMKLRNIDDAEDAVDDAIMKALSKRNQLKDIDKLKYWLARIVVNHCNDMLRSKKDETTLEERDDFLEDSHVVNNPAVQIELTQEIERVLDVMLTIEPEEYSDILIMYYYRKLSYNQIVEELHIPMGTVKSRLNRARDVLQQVMKKEGFTSQDLEKISDLSQWPEIRFIY